LLVKTLILTALLAALAAPAAAQSGASRDRSDIRQVKVRFSDLDLTSKAGAEKMIWRFRHAARTVCGREPDLRELVASARDSLCITSAMNAAVSQLNAPLVTATYSRTYPTSLLANR
jgi:UrcA family protein